ncbi:Hypothetical protein, conserved [Pseudomonas putida BIRD-1]|uniref:hypothetical protein n=1 Tax=Pseudomonas putida TaxID=303 RepID=UPI0001F318A5|nr:hypothetical protein [Pseudomonas putida]ADR61325.1 Hypothetical protein, conserved [Pseudomonas putida BIRD-1]
MLVFDPEVVQNGVTDAYLVEHNEELEATVPLYSGIRVGDVLTWYWSTSPSGMHQAGSRPVTQGDINKPLKVIIPGKHILCYFSVDNKLTWIPFPYVPVTLVG